MINSTTETDYPQQMDEDDFVFILNRTVKDILKTRKQDCTKCMYIKGLKGGCLNRSIALATDTYCDYLTMEKCRRPCRPGECRKAGVFRQRKRKAKNSKGEN